MKKGAMKGKYWAAGKGCRDKNVMNKKDSKKYKGMFKTISKKAEKKKNFKAN